MDPKLKNGQNEALAMRVKIFGGKMYGPRQFNDPKTEGQDNRQNADQSAGW